MVRLTKKYRFAAILGAADGLTIVVALAFGRTPAVFHAALDAGLGELVGMSAALYLGDRADPDKAREGSIWSALLCGLATLIACVLPAVPYVLLSTDLARWVSIAIMGVLCTLIARLRPESGWMSIIETWGVVAIAGALCFVVSLIY